MSKSRWRELALNPRRLGKLDNHRQEPWKLPLPVFIELLYSERFRKDHPDVLLSLKDRAHPHEHKEPGRRSV